MLNWFLDQEQFFVFFFLIKDKPTELCQQSKNDPFAGYQGMIEKANNENSNFKNHPFFKKKQKPIPGNKHFPGCSLSTSGIYLQYWSQKELFPYRMPTLQWMWKPMAKYLKTLIIAQSVVGQCLMWGKSLIRWISSPSWLMLTDFSHPVTSLIRQVTTDLACKWSLSRAMVKNI